MKKLLGGIVLFVLVVGAVWPQAHYHQFTTPKVPPKEMLDRLNLEMAWKLRIPLQGQRDGIASAQLIPGPGAVQLVVQTFYGTVLLLDAETGDTLWRTTMGKRYESGPPVGYNSGSIFVVRKDQLYILNRATGLHRLYTLDPHSKLPQYGIPLRGSPTAAPAANGEAIFFAFGTSVAAYALTLYEAAEKAQQLVDDKGQPTGSPGQPSLQPQEVWSTNIGDRYVEQVPLLFANQVGFLASQGNFLSFNKFEGQPRYDFQFFGQVSAPMAQHRHMAYIGGEDFILYALNMVTGRLHWRFLSSSPIYQKPEATDRDLFVTPRGQGLYRIERDLGQVQWQNRTAHKFLATNQKFVYALDKTGLLLLLDYDRGTILAQYDLRDWLVPISNDLTDRVYFANHDGQVLCLRHRLHVLPMKIKTVDLDGPQKKEDKKPEEKKPEDKQPEEKKEDKKEEKKEKGAAEAGGLWPGPGASPPLCLSRSEKFPASRLAFSARSISQPTLNASWEQKSGSYFGGDPRP